METRADGELNASGTGRWCEIHQYDHGHLYMCPAYSDERRSEISAAKARWAQQLTDPDWIRQQVTQGVMTPEEVIIQQVLAGVEPTAEEA